MNSSSPRCGLRDRLPGPRRLRRRSPQRADAGGAGRPPRGASEAPSRRSPDESADALLRLHFSSVLQVVEAGDRRLPEDSESIRALWAAFSDASPPTAPGCARATWIAPGRSSSPGSPRPTARSRSPGSPCRLGWDAEREYPVYVQLHGLWDVAEDRIRYLAYPFSNPGTSFAFEDGYLVSPWGRGNLWYRGIAETDIWEGLAAVKRLVRVDDEPAVPVWPLHGRLRRVAHRPALGRCLGRPGNPRGGPPVRPARGGRERRHRASRPPHVLRRRHLRRPPRGEPDRLRAAPGRRQPAAGLRHLPRRATTTGRRTSSRCTCGCGSSTTPQTGDRSARGRAYLRRVSSAPRSLSASDPNAPDDSTFVRAV